MTELNQKVTKSMPRKCLISECGKSINMHAGLWEDSYLLQCFQALVHLQGISQHSGSLRSNFIVAETVEDRTLKYMQYLL